MRVIFLFFLFSENFSSPSDLGALSREVLNAASPGAYSQRSLPQPAQEGLGDHHAVARSVPPSGPTKSPAAAIPQAPPSSGTSREMMSSPSRNGHNDTCVQSSVSVEPAASPKSSIKNPTAKWGCEFACGFQGNFFDVQAHETTCPLSPQNSPAVPMKTAPQAWDEKDGEVDSSTDNMAKTPASPAARYACNWDCGFTGGYDEASRHELTCQARPSAGAPNSEHTSVQGVNPPVEVLSPSKMSDQEPIHESQTTAKEVTQMVDDATDASAAATEPRRPALQVDTEGDANGGAADAKNTFRSETWPRRSLWNSRSSSLRDHPVSPFLAPGFSPVLALSPMRTFINGAHGTRPVST